MKFSKYLDKNMIFKDIDGSTHEEVIINLLKRMSAEDQIIAKNEKEIEKAILKREEESSTAIGKGVSIPHARLAGLDDVIVGVGVLKNSIEVQTENSKKAEEVKIVFLIVCDILKNKNILKIMSTITKLALKYPEILEKVKVSYSQKEIINLIDSVDLNIEVSQKIIADDVLSPNVKSVTEDTTLEEIAKRLIIEKIGGIPVVDEDNNFLGEITEKELIEFGMPKYLSLMSDLNFLTVGEPFEEYLLNEKTAIIKDLYRKKEKLCVLDRKAPIMEICFLMLSKGFTRIYIEENGKYYGIIRRYDIIKKILHL